MAFERANVYRLISPTNWTLHIEDAICYGLRYSRKHINSAGWKVWRLEGVRGKKSAAVFEFAEAPDGRIYRRMMSPDISTNDTKPQVARSYQVVRDMINDNKYRKSAKSPAVS